MAATGMTAGLAGFMLAGAMLTLVGLQFTIYWLLMRVLEELSHREELTDQDVEPLTV